MQTVKNRLTTTAIMVCALIAIAFGGVAFAAGNWWTSDSNTLTVIAETNESLKADIEAGHTTINVDVYQVATAEADEAYETFNYTLAGLFDNETLASRLAAAQEDSEGGAQWDLLGKEALEIAKNAEPVKTGVIGGAEGAEARVDIDGLPNGLYLVVPHGAEADATTLEAIGLSAKYSFTPSMIALPTKYNEGYADRGYINANTEGEGDPYEAVNTAGDGDWQTEVAVALKVKVSPLYGSLKIVKKVTEFAGSPFTCKFRIESTEDSPWVYQNTAAITVSSADGGEVVIDQIPAGAIVTVEEVYAGAGYEFVSSDCDGKEFTIPSDAAVKAGEILPTATFTNKPNNGTEGHGVQNKFVQENGEWHLKDATSADDAVIETESPK